jgi:hypothetical protein
MKQSLRTKQRALFLNKANAACGGEPGDSRSGEPPCRETAARAILRIAKNNLRKKRLQTTQAYELQNRKKNSDQTTANKQRFLTLPRHYAASGLLNLQTALVQAVACTTPGVKLPFQR